MNDNLRSQFDALANRGTPRGADAVLDTAGAHAAASLDAARKDTVMTDDLTPIVDDLVVDMQPRNPRPSRRSRGVAGLGIAALLGIGGYAAIATQGGGGASSPEAAVEQFARALDDEDALAAIDVLAPREVRSLERSVKTASNKAKQLEMVDDATDPFAGFDIDVDGLETDVEELAPGFAKVTITGGTITADVDPGGLAERFRDMEPGEPEQVDLAEVDVFGGDSDDSVACDSFGECTTVADSNDDAKTAMFVVAIKDGDGWYLSPAYTGFEYAREAYERDQNTTVSVEYGSAEGANLGAADPEAAVRDAFGAIEDSDWNRLIELAPPGELPIWEYRNLLTDAIADEEPSTMRVESLDITIENDGDQATALIEASGTTEGGTWQLGGECDNDFWAGDDGEIERVCFAGNARGVVPLGLFMGASTGTDSGPLEIQLVRENGRWFVSPVGTVLNAVDGFVESFDADLLASMTGDWDEIEPDGSIAYGDAVTVQPGGPRVYTFEGQAGDELFAQTDRLVSITLVGPDGDEVENGWDLTYQGLTLDESGTYRMVVWVYSGDQSVTLVEGGLAAIEPTGAIELGVETTIDGLEVFTFAGAAGQEIFGQANNADLVLIDPSGRVRDDIYGLGYAEVVTLDAPGEYRVVVRPYDSKATFTIWNRADAPEGIEQGEFGPTFPGDGGVEECSSDGTLTTCIQYDADGNVIGEYAYEETGTPETVPTSVAPSTTAAL